MKRSSITTFTRSVVLLGSLIGGTALAQPVIHDVYPSGTVQLQATNELTFGATTGGFDINATGISVQLTSLNLLGQTQVTNLTSVNGLIITGTVSERSVSAPLQTNILNYTAVIIVTDANGGSATNTVQFDTLSPVFTIEAEDFNHDNGVFIEPAVPGSYAGYGATDNVDAHGVNYDPNPWSSAYRSSGLNTESTGDKQRQVFIDAGWADYNVGWTDGGEWGNYTRTLPVGVYNVYMRAARGNGGNGVATLALVMSDPTQSGQTTSDLGTFTLASTFHGQHDIRGLAGLMGGPKAAEAKLDELFRAALGRSKYEFFSVFPDSTGMVGQYSMGNEPSFVTPYLYNHLGAPWKTQKRLRQLLEIWFTDTALGIPGDEDGGGMSAFVVFSMMGFYPVVPGVPVYELGSPVFDKVTIQLSNGKKLRLLAPGTSRDHKYISSVCLNGQPQNRLWFRHADVLKGLTITTDMSDTPNLTLGVRGEDQPPSSLMLDPRPLQSSEEKMAGNNHRQERQ